MNLEHRRSALTSWLLNHPQRPVSSELAPDDVIDFVMVRMRPQKIAVMRRQFVPTQRFFADAVRTTSRYLRILSTSGRSHGAIATAREAWIARGVPKLIATILTRAALSRRFEQDEKK